MPAIVSNKVVALAQAADPKKALTDAVGDLSKEEVRPDAVFTVTYFRPEKTRGGIIRPAENVKEDAFQGKVGLILKLGDQVEEEGFWKVGDWIVYSVNDAWSITFNDVPCRIVRDSAIRMRISDPTKVF